MSRRLRRISFVMCLSPELSAFFSEIKYKSYQNPLEHTENGKPNRPSLRKVNFISSIFALTLRKLYLFLFSQGTPFSEEGYSRVMLELRYRVTAKICNSSLVLRVPYSLPQRTIISHTLRTLLVAKAFLFFNHMMLFII